MANIPTILDDFEIPDLIDGSKLRIRVELYRERDEDAPGLRVHFLGRVLNYTVANARGWAGAYPPPGAPLLLTEDSWIEHEDRFVKNYLVMSEPPKARVEIKTRSRKHAVVREYELPFKVEKV